MRVRLRVAVFAGRVRGGVRSTEQTKRYPRFESVSTKRGVGRGISEHIAQFADGLVDGPIEIDECPSASVVGYSAPGHHGPAVHIGPARRATATLDVDVALKDGIVVQETTVKPRWFAANWLSGSIQLALTMMLLVGAGLLVKSLARIQSFDPGYDSANAASVRFDLPPARYRTDADVARFVGDMTERLGAVPGVEAVGATSSLPYAAGALQMRHVLFEEPVRVAGPPEPMPLGWRVPPAPPPASGMDALALDFYPALSCEVGPAFFRAMRIPLLMGREFTSFDNSTSPPVIIINRAMAERYWSGVNPIGRRMRLGPLYPWKTMIGVVDNIRRFARDDAIRSEYYEPFAQAGDQRRLTANSWPIHWPDMMLLASWLQESPE